MAEGNLYPPLFFSFFLCVYILVLTGSVFSCPSDELSWMDFLGEPARDEATSQQRIEGVEVVDLEELVAYVVAATTVPIAQSMVDAQLIAGGTEVVGDNLPRVPAPSPAPGSGLSPRPGGRSLGRIVPILRLLPP